MKKFFYILILLAMANLLVAQNQYTITGTMVDSLNKEKVMFATIGLLSPDSTAQMVSRSLTDAQGKFQMSNVPAGEYRFVASLVGYEMLNIPLTVGGGSRTIDMGDIPMRKTSTDLEEVKIIGEKPVYMVDGEKTLYNVSEDPTIQSGSAADALQNAPGVEVDVEGNVTLRGVSSVEIWINNKPIQHECRGTQAVHPADARRQH
ncbi:MAG: carboxypeptidase-like regulatory domain-containing protein [Bacteroidales bacterium]|nr:carboxypeptidase-like regulatory domain-containing protein [Bacteroidales bacterium]